MSRDPWVLPEWPTSLSRWLVRRDTRTRRKVRALLVRDGVRCWICTEEFSGERNRKPTLDHVLPRAHGGTDRLDNLRLAHRVCNQERGAPAPVPGRLG